MQRRTTFLLAWILDIALVWLATMLLRHNALTFITFTEPWLQVSGAALLISATAFTVGLIAVIIKATSEERLMKETFGEQYTHYQQRVPRLILGKQLLTSQR